jgi:hypothetical protein
VIVDDAPTSTNMKDKVWSSLMQLFPILRSMPQIPPEFYINAMKYSPAPAAFVQEAQRILQQKPPPNPDQQAKTDYDQARAEETRARAAMHIMEGRHTAAETGRVGAETTRIGVDTQLAPTETNLKVLKQQADIEKTRADAANALQNAGIAADDQRFQQTMAAVDALLRVHGAAMDHVQGMHQRALDLAPPEPAEAAS